MMLKQQHRIGAGCLTLCALLIYLLITALAFSLGIYALSQAVKAENGVKVFSCGALRLAAEGIHGNTKHGGFKSLVTTLSSLRNVTKHSHIADELATFHSDWEALSAKYNETMYIMRVNSQQHNHTCAACTATRDLIKVAYEDLRTNKDYRSNLCRSLPDPSLNKERHSLHLNISMAAESVSYFQEGILVRVRQFLLNTNNKLAMAATANSVLTGLSIVLMMAMGLFFCATFIVILIYKFKRVESYPVWPVAVAQMSSLTCAIIALILAGLMLVAAIISSDMCGYTRDKLLTISGWDRAINATTAPWKVAEVGKTCLSAEGSGSLAGMIDLNGLTNYRQMLESFRKKTAEDYDKKKIFDDKVFDASFIKEIEKVGMVAVYIPTITEKNKGLEQFVNSTLSDNDVILAGVKYTGILHFNSNLAKLGSKAALPWRVDCFGANGSNVIKSNNPSDEKLRYLQELTEEHKAVLRLGRTKCQAISHDTSTYECSSGECEYQKANQTMYGTVSEFKEAVRKVVGSCGLLISKVKDEQLEKMLDDSKVSLQDNVSCSNLWDRTRQSLVGLCNQAHTSMFSLPGSWIGLSIALMCGYVVTFLLWRHYMDVLTFDFFPDRQLFDKSPNPMNNVILYEVGGDVDTGGRRSYPEALVRQHTERNAETQSQPHSYQFFV
eukprot:Filipodium_phascolosomae@DN1714_c0_g1_i1.p1